MKPINVVFIDAADQRYNTCGDYWETPSSIEVRITETRNPQYAQLVLIHELIELFLVLQRKISLRDIDNFDMEYVDDGEPGDDPAAPYHVEHTFATRIERQCADEMHVDWDAYSSAIENGEPVPPYDPCYDYDV
jgi:hypothetical protein